MTVVKGSLSQLEKYTLIGMKISGLTPTEMKSLLNRAKDSSAVDNFLKQLDKNARAAKLALDRSPSIKEQPADDYNVTYDRQAVLSKMAQAGIHGDVAISLIQKALPKFKDRTAEVSEIYNEAMRHVGARELMVKTTDAGDKGVMIMTESSAIRSEGVRRSVREVPDSVFYVNEKRTNGKK